MGQVPEVCLAAEQAKDTDRASNTCVSDDTMGVELHVLPNGRDSYGELEIS